MFSSARFLFVASLFIASTASCAILSPVRADTPIVKTEADTELLLRRAKELQKGGQFAEAIQEYDRLLQVLGVPLRSGEIKGYDQIKPDSVDNPELVLRILSEILDVYSAGYDGQAPHASSTLGDPINARHAFVAFNTLFLHVRARAIDHVNIDEFVARADRLRLDGRTIEAIQAYDEALRAYGVSLKSSEDKGYDNIDTATVSEPEKLGYIFRHIAIAYNSLDFEADPSLSAKIGGSVNGLHAAEKAISLLSIARYRLGLGSEERKLAIGADLRPMYDIHIKNLLDVYWLDPNPYILLAATGAIYESRARVLTEILWLKRYLDIKIRNEEWSSQRDLIKRWALYAYLIGTLNRSIKEEHFESNPRPKLLQDLKLRLEYSRARFGDMLLPVHKATKDVGLSVKDLSGIQLPTPDLRGAGAVYFLTYPGLEAGDIILNFHVTPNYVYALLFRGKTVLPEDIKIVRLKKKPDVLRKDIENYLAQIRRKDAAWLRKSQKLFIDIFENLGHYLKGKRNVFVVPSGFLNDLPLQTLIDPLSNTPVTQKFGLSILPTAAFLSPLLNSWAAIFSSPIAAPERRAMLVGVKEFDDLPDLRHSESEVIAIKNALGGEAEVFLSSKGDATRARVLKTMQDYPIVHISSHAMHDRRPLYSRFILRGPNKKDQSISGFDLLQPELQLQPGLVTLSACETGVGRYDAGEEVMGLIRAFLIAGARTVAASMWPVEEKATKIIMERFYAELAQPGTSVNTALYRAQNWLRTSNEQPEYAHPYYWGAFVTYGDGRIWFRNPE
jgi:CHAT domain-containing protein